MAAARLNGRSLICLVILSGLALLPGLGSSSRLTYHEAFVAQGAREILDSGNWVYPTIGGLPWLEKPPLPWWLVAAYGYCAGSVDEIAARLPSALAATLLALGVAVFAARHYGPAIGLMAGAVQATTMWTVMRGRLAEADILLACLMSWAIVAFDHMLFNKSSRCVISFARSTQNWRFWRWVFFGLLGLTSLVKGIGFGAILTLAIIAGILLWQRDRESFRRLKLPAGWLLMALISFWWPFLILVRHGYGALSLWSMHVSDRLVRQQGSGPFAGESWWEYGWGLVGQTLPWAPLAAVGAGRSLIRALEPASATSDQVRDRMPVLVTAGDRILWVWAVVPLALLALAPVKNAHYAISAQVPWSVWSALALARIKERLEVHGYAPARLSQAARLGFAGLALAYGLGLWLMGPWIDRRGVEWGFYQAAGCEIPVSMPLILLYDDWDRNPYKSPFGSIPHDLAVRLFYLGRPASWYIAQSALSPHDGLMRCLSLTTVRSLDPAVAVIGRDRDLPLLHQLGHVETMMAGPRIRYDRSFNLFRISIR